MIGGGDSTIIVENSHNLPFLDKTFDTVSLVACLNHIIEREKTIKELKRVSKDDGVILITMISPIIGYIRHKLSFWWDKDQKERGMKKEEKFGLTKEYIVNLMSNNGFILIDHIRFLIFNNLYIFKQAIE